MERRISPPDGNIHICFSGGRTSAYMLRLFADTLEGGAWPDAWRVVFANTGCERPQTLDFVRDVSAKWGIPITWVEFERGRRPDGKNAYLFKVVNHNSASRDGEPFEKLIACKRQVPNVMMRFCTAELKIVPAAKVCRDVFGWSEWSSALGIRADEQRRVRPSRDKRWQNIHPLVEVGVTAEDVATFWRQQDFDLELPNLNGKCWLSNCDGCFLKSEEHLANLRRQFPDRAAWWDRMERETGGTFNKRWSRADLHRKIESMPELALDTEGFFCQASDGDCTG